jgi:hypothetical protein
MESFFNRSKGVTRLDNDEKILRTYYDPCCCNLVLMLLMLFVKRADFKDAVLIRTSAR